MLPMMACNSPTTINMQHIITESSVWAYIDEDGKYLDVDFGIADSIDGFEFTNKIRYYDSTEIAIINELVKNCIHKPVTVKKFNLILTLNDA